MRCRTCEGATAAQDELVVPMNSLQCVPRQIHSEILDLGDRRDVIPAAVHMHARLRGYNESLTTPAIELLVACAATMLGSMRTNRTPRAAVDLECWKGGLKARSTLDPRKLRRVVRPLHGTAAPF